jgi:hypothetical protein
MLQQITVTMNTSAALRPLLESAIHTESKAMGMGMGVQRTRVRLAEFEQRFGLTSDEFERMFAARELDESLDFIEWLGEIKTLRLLEEQQRALQGLTIN